jgi:hypothetical protein
MLLPPYTCMSPRSDCAPAASGALNETVACEPDPVSTRVPSARLLASWLIVRPWLSPGGV